MNTELQVMCREETVAYCGVIFRNFSVDTEENHQNVLG